MLVLQRPTDILSTPLTPYRQETLVLCLRPKHVTDWCISLLRVKHILHVCLECQVLNLKKSYNCLQTTEQSDFHNANDRGQNNNSLRVCVTYCPKLCFLRDMHTCSNKIKVQQANNAMKIRSCFIYNNNIALQTIISCHILECHNYNYSTKSAVLSSSPLHIFR